MLNALGWRRRKSNISTSTPPPPSGFAFTPGTGSATNWGTWSRSQPSPVFKPGHKLHYLSLYIYGFEQEYDLALDQADRWGYALNVGYVVDTDNVVTDSKLATPVTSKGKLLKKAVADPAKYPIAAAVGQVFPPANLAPGGYVKDSNGSITGEWSPAATPQAMATAVNYKMDALRKLKATGARIAVAQDGGETGVHVPGSAKALREADPAIIADRGSLEWTDYISRRKADQHKLVFDAVKTEIPDRQNYVYYPCAGNPYQNIPGVADSNFDYQYMQTICDLPSGSVYFRDFFSSTAGMGNPTIRDRAYYDQLTHWLAAVAEQISYGKPLSYCYVSAGYNHELGGDESSFFLNLVSYKGFLKCMYASGMLGGIAGYFSPDCAVQHPRYTSYSANNPPHWLLQQMLLGEIHARFSWLDEYIVNGDLLPGTAGLVKPNLPSYEMGAYRKVGVTYQIIPNIRVLCRKLKTADKWLVVAWSPELDYNIPGADTSFVFRGIPSLGAIDLAAKGNGSIYTIDGTSGIAVVKHEDADDV